LKKYQTFFIFLKLFLVGTIAIFITGIDTFSSKNEKLATDGSIKTQSRGRTLTGFAQPSSG
jgi:hypothetical protein